MFWRSFKTKKAATLAFRQILDVEPFVKPFENSMLSDLIHERHYFCSKHDLRPLRFRKIRDYGHYRLEGEFTGIGWHPVSWTKCIEKLWTPWDYVVRAMRDHVEDIKTSYRRLNPICEHCYSNESEQVHHAAPTFLEITQRVREQVADAEIENCLHGWNWLEKENFVLPPGHKIALLFEKIHATAKLEAVCKKCHDATKSRKRNLPESPNAF